MRLLCRISLEPDSCVRKTEEAFGRNGARALIVPKFVPGLSTAAPPMAGVFGMRRSRFLMYDALGALLWPGWRSFSSDAAFEGSGLSPEGSMRGARTDFPSIETDDS